MGSEDASSIPPSPLFFTWLLTSSAVWIAPVPTESPPSQASVQLTEQQHRAVVMRDASVVLSSGAGCGKTTVLTERYLSHLRDDGAEVGQVVAITFTDRAARQMRGRIREQVEKQLRTADADDAPRIPGLAISAIWKRRRSAPSTPFAPPCCVSTPSKRAWIRASTCWKKCCPSTWKRKRSIPVCKGC